jgi:hypothetical protein
MLKNLAEERYLLNRFPLVLVRMIKIRRFRRKKKTKELLSPAQWSMRYQELGFNKMYRRANKIRRMTALLFKSVGMAIDMRESGTRAKLTAMVNAITLMGTSIKVSG